MAGFPEHLVGNLGVYYRLHENEDGFIPDDTVEQDDEISGFRRAYTFTIVRKGHVHCCCMRSIRVRYFRYHINGTDGDWPMHYFVTLEHGRDVAAMLGDDYEVYMRQFGFIRLSPNRNLANTPPWLLPVRLSGVFVVTSSDSD